MDEIVTQLVGDYHPIEDLRDLQIMLQLYQRLAEAYREAEDFEQAVESLERIIELAPNGTMVSETMLKLALLHWRESTDSHTGILASW